ncbi:hypothetical protein KBC75_03350 [Candidatus Shapirobacteria bacterium]|nr:hypothetical protein [Candidatus Shapirobacteria bacterium]
MFKKIRFTSEYLYYYLKKNLVYIILSTLIGSLLFVERNFLISQYNRYFTNQKTIGLEGLYTINTLPLEITQLISYGLTTTNNNSHITPSSIVKSVEVSENNLVYTFTINDNFYWHDDQKLTSYDINLRINGIKTEPKNKNTLVVTLDNNYSPLFNILTRPLFLGKSLIGLGEYQVINSTYQDGFFKTLTIQSSKTYQKISYHFYPNENDINNAYKLGEVDEIQTTALASEFSAWPKTKINPEITTNSYIAIFLNTEKINNKQARQALAYATPKTDDKNERCLGPISPSSWAYNSQIKEYNFNITRAKELFDKNRIEKINLLVTDRKLLPIAEQVKESWSQNLKINVTVTSNSNSLDNSDAILTFAPIPSDPDQYFFWHSTQTKTNLSQLNNSRIDKLLEEGRRVYDQQERRDIYLDFQRFLLEESPAIFLKFPTTYFITRVK